MAIRPHRRATATLIGISTAILAGFAIATPAHASAYRYWSYWQGANGEWTVSQTGPGETKIADQAVQGWRFAISSEAVSVMPDNPPEFASLCPDLSAAVSGNLRVAVVIDSGFSADAPPGQAVPADVVNCVTVPEGSTGNQALAAAASSTVKDGLVCSINGYPTDECGIPISDSDAKKAAIAAGEEKPNPVSLAAPIGASPEPVGEGAPGSEDSSSLPMILGIAAVVGTLGAGLVVARRRSDQANSAQG